MEVIINKFPGLLATCDKCGSILRWTPQDVYGKVVYCPLCKNSIEVPFDKNYDGVIKEQEIKEKNE